LCRMTAAGIGGPSGSSSSHHFCTGVAAEGGGSGFSLGLPAYCARVIWLGGSLVTNPNSLSAKPWQTKS
jgi:hypothetical protein